MKAKTSFTTILCGALYLSLSCNKFEFYIKQASFHQTSKQPLSSLPFHLCGNIFPTHFFMAKTGSRPSKCLFIALLLSQERQLFTALLLFQERQSFIKTLIPPCTQPLTHHTSWYTDTHTSCIFKDYNRSTGAQCGDQKIILPLTSFSKRGLNSVNKSRILIVGW